MWSSCMYIVVKHFDINFEINLIGSTSVRKTVICASCKVLLYSPIWPITDLIFNQVPRASDVATKFIRSLKAIIHWLIFWKKSTIPIGLLWTVHTCGAILKIKLVEMNYLSSFTSVAATKRRIRRCCHNHPIHNKTVLSTRR